jgi:hypothetical protein
MISEEDRDYLFQKLNEILDKVEREVSMIAQEGFGKGAIWAISIIRKEIQKVV